MELQQQLRLERIRTASLSLPLLVGAFLCVVQVVSRGPFYATFERDGRDQYITMSVNKTLVKKPNDTST